MHNGEKDYFIYLKRNCNWEMPGIDMSQCVPGLNPSLIKKSDKKITENIKYALNE